MAETRWSPLRAIRLGLSRDLELTIGAVLLGILIIAFVAVPPLWPHGPDDIVGAAFQPPSWSYPFGTDSVGRDLFIRVLAAGRLDVLVGLLTVGASLGIGVLLGTAAAASQLRFVDGFLMRVVDAVIAFPFLILVLVLVALFGSTRSIGPLPSGVPSLIAAIVLVDWAIYARLARGQTLSLRQREYITAARLIGYSPSRIVRRHLLPGVLGISMAYAVGDIILVVITVASLSFIGLGVQQPTPEWGSIMFEGAAVLGTAWWITIFPGLALVATGLAGTLVADALLSDNRR